MRPSQPVGKDRLAGSNHPQVRRYLHLKRHPGGDHPTTVALEGTTLLERALVARVRIECVFTCPALLRGEKARRVLREVDELGVPTLIVSERLFRRMVDRDGPDGVAALALLPACTLEDIRLHNSARVVVTVGVELPGNLGTLVRCADASGASAVVSIAGVRRTHPLVARASMGTLFSMPVVETTTDDAIAWLRRHSFRLVAADPSAATPYREIDYRGRVAVVLGAEREGLTPKWKANADEVVAIPMHGIADSVNVAIAGAILLYEALAHA
jgi:RNA methyltransferase, TrmH family